MFAAVWLVVHGYATSAAEALQMLQSTRPAIALRRRQHNAVIEAVRLSCTSMALEETHVAAAATATRTSVPQQEEAADRERTEIALPQPHTAQNSHLKEDCVPWWVIAIMLLVFVQFSALTYFTFSSLGLVWYDFDGTIADWYALLVFALVGGSLLTWLVMALYAIHKEFIAPTLANRRSAPRRLDGSD